jgi:pimeloyl-ACP methyl ester carboxylesterase
LQSGDYDIAALGKSLAAVLDATVPDGHIILVGHSMGGMTIMAFAEQHPEWFGNRVTGVVLISTSAGLIDKTKLGCRRWSRGPARRSSRSGARRPPRRHRDRPGPGGLRRSGRLLTRPVRAFGDARPAVVGHLSWRA